MTYQETMAALKKVGTAQNIKIYRRHGANGDLFGVSFGELNKLKKKIKVDHELALKLWESGNVDARTLATMIADPSQLTPAVADRWVKDIDYYLLGDLFASLIAKTNHAETRIAKWTNVKKEFVRQTGYAALASALRDKVEIKNETCRQYLKMIENEIHASPNRARHSMNMAVAAIGIFRPELAKEAIAAAERIGHVEVDHGETSCKTPDAADYIRKALARKK